MAAYSTATLDIFHFCFWLVGMTPNRTGYNQRWLTCSKSPIAKPEPYPNLAALPKNPLRLLFTTPRTLVVVFPSGVGAGKRPGKISHSKTSS